MHMHSLPANTAPLQETNSFRSMVEAAFRFHRLWFLVVFTILLITAAYILLVPREYRSQMDILVQNKRGDEQITPSRISGEITINGVTEEQINSEIQLLVSRALAEKVLDPNWNSHSAASMTNLQLRRHDKAIAEFEKHLSVSMVRKSNVIHVAYVAHSAKAATNALNRLLTAFLVKQKQIAQPPGTAQFFATQAASYKQRLDQAQQQLAAFQKQEKIVSLPSTEQALDSEIDQTQSELRATNAQISELSRQLGSQTAHLRTIPPRQMTEVRTIPNDYSIERLNTMLAQMENKRTSLLTRFTPKDRLVQEINRQIAQTRAALSNAEQMTSKEHDTDVNPVWQAVTGSIIQNETRKEALKAKQYALTKQVSGLQNQLSDVEGSTVAFNTLKQKVADLESNYQLYAQKRDEAQIADAMNTNRLLNVAVAQSPTFSVTPYRPKPLLDSALGAFTAVFFATFLLFFAEMGRNTYATSIEVENLLHLPVFAEVPLLRGRNVERKKEFAPIIIGMASSEIRRSTQETAGPALVQHRKEPGIL